MQARSGGTVWGRLRQGVTAARGLEQGRVDCRAALCRFEDALFAAFPAGHEIIDFDTAVAMIGELFRACGRPAPALDIVGGFEDPRIGGFADVARHRIAIERGFLYRFLVLHECAHILVPEDRLHGPAFIFALQLLYRHFIDIPEAAIRHHLRRQGLPDTTQLASSARPLALAG
jgi:hypothetical protein